LKAYVTPAICEFNHWLDYQTTAWDDIAMMRMMPGEGVITTA
jgi:hypothetical protein